MSATTRKRKPCKVYGAAHRVADVAWEATPPGERPSIVRQRCTGCGKVTDWLSAAQRAAREAGVA